MSLYRQIRALVDQRASAADEADKMARLLGTENRDFTAEEQEKFDRIHEDVERWTGQIERLERQRELNASLEESRGARGGLQDGEEDQADSDDDNGASQRTAFETWLRRGHAALSREEREALNCQPSDKRSEIRMRPPQNDQREVQRLVALLQARGVDTRSLSTEVGELGGYTVPDEFWGSMVEAQLQFGGIRQSRAFQFRTATGRKIPVPTANDVNNKGTRIDENQETDEDDMVFGQVFLEAYKYSSKAIRVPFELLEDSEFPIGPYVGRKLGERIGRVHADDFTIGDGDKKPTGVVAASPEGHLAPSNVAIAYFDFLALKHSVDPAYRTAAEWMFNDSTLHAAKKLLDLQGRPMWQAGMAVGQPNTIDGDPYTLNQSMAAIGPGSRSMLYGDLSNHWIRDVGEIRLKRLDEKYADHDQIGFLAFSRNDSNLIDAGTGPVKHMAHPQ